ncbi:MAG: polyprenyl synthetase family protein [Candidatus Marinimicrobia bacterium]|nr:polyprenyl synthetase family protein [Candidatus Neomarinimicrobiota bacterium]
MTTKLDFKLFYKEYIPLFDKGYKRCVHNTVPASLYDPVYYILEHSGKQIRPAFLSAIAYSFGNISFEDSFPAASCLEMIHNFTLVHDDIMDGDIMRHGKETVHVKWNENQAILSGDGLFAMALMQLDQYTNDAKLYAKIMPLILHAVSIVCEGQAQDMEFESRIDVKLSEYLEMVEKKTAYLLAVSARVGAVIGGAEKDEELLVEKIIRELGVVFQIQDDLLELTSDNENMGKTLGSDLIKQKKTFPYLFAKQELAQLEWNKFQEYIKSDYVKHNGVQSARQILEDNFIFDRIHEVITLRHVAIQELIKGLPEGNQKMFNSMVEFIMNRKN